MTKPESPPGYALVPLIVTDEMAQAAGTTLWQDMWDRILEAAKVETKPRKREVRK